MIRKLSFAEFHLLLTQKRLARQFGLPDETHKGTRRASRYWPVPLRRIEARQMLLDTFASAEPWRELMVWSPHGRHLELMLDRGGWGSRLLERVARSARHAPLVQVEDEAVVCDSSALLELCDLLWALNVDGGYWVDLYILTDSSTLFFFEHHQVIHARFENQAQLEEFTQRMLARGHPLDEHPPDPTFKYNPDGSPA
jgi:hypothetical protein